MPTDALPLHVAAVLESCSSSCTRPPGTFRSRPNRSEEARIEHQTVLRVGGLLRCREGGWQAVKPRSRRRRSRICAGCRRHGRCAGWP